MTATATAVPSCPRCNGEMWDNREDKKNPKAPDFKCKDKACVDDKGFVTALWADKKFAKAAPAKRAPNPSYTPPHAPPMPPGLEEPEWLQGHEEEVAANVREIVDGAAAPHPQTLLPSEQAAKRGLRFIKKVVVPELPADMQEDPLVWSQLMRVLNGFIVSNERYYKS